MHTTGRPLALACTTRETGAVTEAERVAMTPGLLARSGFANSQAAGSALERLGLGTDPAIVSALAETADPDSALAGLAKLADAASDWAQLLSALRRDEGFRDRLLGV